MKKKIGIVSLGCPKNLVDSEIMLGILKKEKYEITSDKEEAEIIIVNTCGFIESAKQESIDAVLEMADYKKGACELLIVTGCLAQRYSEDILKEIPEVDAVVGTEGYGEIARLIRSISSDESLQKGSETKSLRSFVTEYSNAGSLLDKSNRVEYLNNDRILSTKNGYAYLKIAEGCNNCCTYCIIPKLRGSYTSRKVEDIVKEARYLAERKVKEVILVAQDVTSYGKDIYSERKLVDLIREISRIEGIEWIRLLYCYPEEIDDSLIEEIANNPKVVKYLDIPVQHISDRILKLMGRRGTKEQIEGLLLKLRHKIPEIVIRTSLIVGFPGEDEEDFKLLREFVERFEFEMLGVFTYSKEEGTPAYKMKHQIKKSIKQLRYNDIMLHQKEIALRKNQMRLNKLYRTLVEGVSDDGIFYCGRTYAEAPEIDGIIYFTSLEPLSEGDFVNVKILNTDDYDLIGEVINESSQ